MSERTLFLAALAITDPSARADYLEKECANDAALHQRIEALLKAHVEAGSFLERPALDDAATGAYTRPANDDAKGHKEIGQSNPQGSTADGPGTRIGPYKLLQQIGEGGMGVVYMAEQQEPVRRMVALKIIKSGMDSIEVVARFDAERQALAVMDHQNIAKVFDAGTTTTGRLYFVMELVKGTPITKYCDEHRLTPRERLELFMPVCHALQHAHQKGIIHRDIKPSNVLVAPYDGKPVVKVIDFGIAKATGQRLTERTMFTEFGAVLGTLEYMSPEQAELNNQDIDTRSDIYSLGVLLYELLTGTTPLDRSRLKKAAFTEMLRIIREEEPPRPSMRLSDSNELPSISAQRQTEPAKLSKLMRGDLDWIVMKSLDKDRARRYETANGLARDIERYLKDEAVEACPPSAGYRLKKFLRRNKGPTFAVGVVIGVLMLGVGISSWQAVRATRAEATAERSRREAEANERLARAEAMRALSARHAIQIQLALRAWEQNDLTEAESILGQVDQSFRDTWEQRHLLALCRRKGLVINTFASGVALSGDGQRVAAGYPDRLVLFDAATGKELFRQSFPFGDSVTSVAISNDGNCTVSGHSDGALRVWNGTKGQEKFVLKGHKFQVPCLSISADGKRCVSEGWGENTVKVWNTETGQELMTVDAHPSSIFGVALSADGKRFVTVSIRVLKVWDAITGQEILAIESDAVISCVAINADGRRVVFGCTDGSIKVWNADSNREEFLFKSHTREVKSVAISVTGDCIASAGNDNSAIVWNGLTGHQTHSFKLSERRNPQVAISADGQRLVTTCGVDSSSIVVWNTAASNSVVSQDSLTLKEPRAIARTVAFDEFSKPVMAGNLGKDVIVWNSVNGEEGTLKGHADDVLKVLISSNAERLVTGSADKTLKVWDIPGRQELLSLKGHTDHIFQLDMSHDGSRIVSAAGTVKVWNAATGHEVLSLKEQSRCVAISGNGQRIVSTLLTSLKVWNADTGQELLEIHNVLNVNCLAMSRDGKLVISGHDDGAIKVWDTEAGGPEKLKLMGHKSTVRSLLISADNQRIISGGQDQTVRFWDVVTGQEKLVLKGHSAAVISVATSPDGQRLVTSSDDGTVKVWEAPFVVAK